MNAQRIKAQEIVSFQSEDGSGNLEDKKVYLYKSIENMKSDNGEFIGSISNYSFTVIGTNTLYTKINSKEKSHNLNKYWGFKIGDDVFKMKTNYPKLPLQIMGENQKIFYLNGYFSMKKKLGYKPELWADHKHLFYSETLESKIIYINKIKASKSDSDDYIKLCDCIDSKKRRRIRPFNAKLDCVRRFLN